jgi:pimeloyl-ACP methyl ester carboxylesterase
MFSLAHTTLHQGRSKALVIIHGLLGQGRNWRSLQRSFGARLPDHSVTTLDLRNHGDSPHCDSMSIDDLAEDVAGLLLDLKCDKYSVLGHSLGGKASTVNEDGARCLFFKKRTGRHAFGPDKTRSC